MANKPDVKLIEKTLMALTHERSKFLALQAEHADKRKALAYDAHVGDTGAGKLLDRLQHHICFWPLLGTKRTSLGHAAMSAFDPKRTSCRSCQ